MDDKTMKKTDKSNQIVHEAEITRQHARYKIPAKIEIDGKIYHLEDWSVSGCGIENLPDDVFNKKFAVGKMLFKFDDFETSVDNLKLEFITRRPDGVVGCRFTELTPQQFSILNEIIASYLEGDIITEEDIIHAVTRTITYEKKEKPKVDKKKSILILILIYSFVIFLILFLFYIIYKRIFVVQTENAFVDVNITVIRAPAPSYVSYPKKLYVGDKVKKGDRLLTSYLVAGGLQGIASPIDGKILKISALNGEFRNVAEPILYLLSDSNNSIYITTHVLHKDLIKLKIGDIATVVTPKKEKFYAKLVKIIPAHTIYQEKAKHLLENIYNQARNYDTLIFYTNYPLNRKMINTSLFVTIDTLLNRVGLLSLNDNKKINLNNDKIIEKNSSFIKKENKIEYNTSTAKIDAIKEVKYCIIVASFKNTYKKSDLSKFLKLFPNGKVDRYKDLYQFKIIGFSDYKSAKLFSKNKVSKYYKHSFIIKCNNKK